MKSQTFKRSSSHGQPSREQGAAPNLGRVSRMHRQEISAQLGRRGNDSQSRDLRVIQKRKTSLLGRRILIVMTLILAAGGIAFCWWVLRADATLAVR